MVLPYTPDQMSYAFEAAWTLLKQEQEDEGNPVTHRGPRGRARAERRAERNRGTRPSEMNPTAAARAAGRQTPNSSMYVATHAPHISGQAHNLKNLPFRLDDEFLTYRGPDKTMGRMRMPTTGPVTVPGQAEDMSAPGPMSNDEFEGYLRYMSLLKPQSNPDESRRMQIGDFPVRQG